MSEFINSILAGILFTALNLYIGKYFYLMLKRIKIIKGLDILSDFNNISNNEGLEQRRKKVNQNILLNSIFVLIASLIFAFFLSNNNAILNIFFILTIIHFIIVMKILFKKNKKNLS